ncbi:hypothetical protein [Bacillus sp. T33-2]|uniref:hypothetical protein n=1 Tax=Bacillus sp. T33-2 TaxID=2054168 RepID=UPI000C778D92|nr:hypothetical protein [Bacillus sp. T33-2]PLR97292.1 hypothetical protein CVD19_07330 [Bacillus sp. T33-2]
MGTSGAIEALLKQTQSLPIKTSAFRPGQMVNGKVTRLYPDQMAEVQIGSQKVFAQLETPLSANERYWFQVQPGNGKIHLKVISAISMDPRGEPFAGLLTELGLAASKENVDLIRFFTKEQLPITKETLEMVSDWLKTAGPADKALEAVKMMVRGGLPMTNQVFSAILSAVKNEPLTMLMENLMAALESDGINRDPIVRLLRDMVPAVKSDAGMALTEVVAKEWLKDNGHDSRIAFSLLKTSGIVDKNMSEARFTALLLDQLLVSKDFSPETRHVRSILMHLKDGDIPSALKQVALLDTRALPGLQITEESLQAAAAIMQGKAAEDGLVVKTIPVTDAAAKFLKSLLNLAVADRPVPNTSVSLLAGSGPAASELDARMQALGDLAAKVADAPSKAASPLSEDERNLLRQIGLQAEVQLAKPEGPLLTPASMKEFIARLGLSYEHSLVDGFKNDLQLPELAADSLKPQLLRLLGEQLSPAVRDAAEQLLNKLTGFQLLSQEAGPIQQLIVQIPLPLRDRVGELTIQWSGQKKKDGKIDPDYCRVLFYLDLEHLKQTIVDMQIQNRVMNIHIVSGEDNLKAIAGAHMRELKTSLASLNYVLSSVTFGRQQDPKSPSTTKKMNGFYNTGNYSGVDIRI